MTDEPNSAPIIIVRKKAHHGGHHGGAWKVAYADFVTAMMALFIVLWLLNSSQEVQKAVGGYFQDPSGAGKLMGSTQAGSGAGLMIGKDDMPQLKQKLEQAMQAVPAFETLKHQVQITVTNEGLRVELLESASQSFFETGSAEPSENGQQLMTELARQLALLPNKLLMEGHTDARPFSGTAGYSNWELSTDRANAARRLMQQHGLGADQVEQVRGFADRHLRNPALPEDPANRRVTVIVQYQRQTPSEDPGGAHESGKSSKKTVTHH